MTPAVDAYRIWAPTWDSDPSAIVALEERFLAPCMGQLRGQRVIDVSCGTGRWLARATAQGAITTGIDLCLEMLQCAVRKVGLAGRLCLGDCRQLPFASGCADVVLFTLSLGHVAPAEAAITEIARIAKPGGAVIFSDFHPEAFRRGWKRTFRRDGVLYEVENHYYLPDELLDCARQAGLQLEHFVEPPFDEPERPIFAAAGKLDLFEQVHGIPAVLIARWRKIR
jgi:ubiquinone/menaquinone biosynthesis C-methylase UbiE